MDSNLHCLYTRLSNGKRGTVYCCASSTTVFFMHTFQHEDFSNKHLTVTHSADAQAADAQSADALNNLHLAYGRKVQELLSSSDAASWVENLWDMYTGFTLFAQECGADPKGHNRFLSFKELVFFFQDLGKMEGKLE